MMTGAEVVLRVKLSAEEVEALPALRRFYLEEGLYESIDDTREDCLEVLAREARAFVAEELEEARKYHVMKLSRERAGA